MTTWTRFPATTVLSLAGLSLAGCATAPSPTSLLQQAEAALQGSAAARSLVVTGNGTGNTFGQAWQPTMAWPGLNYATYKRSYNLDTGAFGEEFARSRSEPNGGGAVPLMGGGEQRASGFARDGYAWAPSGQGAFSATPVALAGRINDLWTTTPQGALAAAKRYNATAGQRSEGGKTFSTLSFSVPGRLQATLVLDERQLVTRVESVMPHPVMGDTAASVEFMDYAPNPGVGGLFPQRIRQTQGGFPVLDLKVTSVATGTVDINVPDNVKTFAENVAVQPAAPGVWFLAGGSHNSVAIELSDQIVLVESPLYDGRALAVIAAANRLVPGKSVKTVINSHHHFDHAGGLRAAAGAGAQLITSSQAKPYFERLFANANRVAPDHLAQSGRKPSIVGVEGRTVLRDALRTVEVHDMQGSVHAQGFLMVWLPAEKLLVQADAYTPGAPNTPPPAVPNANHVNLVANIERLGLQPERILPLHSRMVPYTELLAQVGRK
jgi:glyoxylase-like metal-dependent hydrolase (beta-lactamase superfamily II)